MGSLNADVRIVDDVQLATRLSSTADINVDGHVFQGRLATKPAIDEDRVVHRLNRKELSRHSKNLKLYNHYLDHGNQVARCDNEMRPFSKMRTKLFSVMLDWAQRALPR